MKQTRERVFKADLKALLRILSKLNTKSHRLKKVNHNQLKSDTVLSVGISVSSLSDGMFVLHVACEDNKQKVSLICL